MKTSHARLLRRLGWFALAAALVIYWSGCATAPPPARPASEGKTMEPMGSSPIKIK
jgi:hypothetical protein